VPVATASRSHLIYATSSIFRTGVPLFYFVGHRCLPPELLQLLSSCVPGRRAVQRRTRGERIPTGTDIYSSSLLFIVVQRPRAKAIRQIATIRFLQADKEVAVVLRKKL